MESYSARKAQGWRGPMDQPAGMQVARRLGRVGFVATTLAVGMATALLLEPATVRGGGSEFGEAIGMALALAFLPLALGCLTFLDRHGHKHLAVKALPPSLLFGAIAAVVNVGRMPRGLRGAPDADGAVLTTLLVTFLVASLGLLAALYLVQI